MEIEVRPNNQAYTKEVIEENLIAYLTGVIEMYERIRKNRKSYAQLRALNAQWLELGLNGKTEVNRGKQPLRSP